MMRIGIIALALISVFFFPVLFTAVLAFAAGLFAPLLTLAIGMLTDAVYYPGSGLPLATLLGAFGSVLALLVRRFVKARIMS